MNDSQILSPEPKKQSSHKEILFHLQCRRKDIKLKQLGGLKQKYLGSIDRALNPMEHDIKFKSLNIESRELTVL